MANATCRQKIVADTTVGGHLGQEAISPKTTVEIAGWLVEDRKSFTPSSAFLRGVRITGRCRPGPKLLACSFLRE